MSKSVKRIFKIVGIAALGFATFGVGSLLAGGAAIGSALGGGIAIGSLSVSFATLTTVGLAALSIGTLPDLPSLEKTGANKRGQAFIDPEALGVFAFGTTTVPLSLVFERTVAGAGGNDKQISNVFAHAWHRIESYQTLHVDGEEVTFSGDDAQGDWAGILTWQRADGTQSTALTVPGWDTNAVFAGVAHSSMTWNYLADSEKLRSGIPIRFDLVVEGAWLYDPREDTSVGGSGSQNLEDPSTWSFNNGNAALVLLRFLIGEYTPGGQLIWGRGAGYADIDMDSFIAMANVADETVDDKPRFRLGGIHLLDGSFEGFVQRWEQETGGKLAKLGGRYTVWLPHDDLTPLTTITEDKLLNGPIQHTVAGDIRSLYNCARGRYIEPTEGYRGFPYPEVSEATAIEDDGTKCPLYIDFSWVQDVEIAQRVARTQVRRSRFQRIWTVPMGWEGWLPSYAPFTVHTLNIPETGNNDQLVRVIDRKLSMSGTAILVLQQEDASIYDDTVPLGDPHASNTTGPRVDRIGAVVPRYIDGTRIDDLRPAEAGADTTLSRIINSALINAGFELGTLEGWTNVISAGATREVVTTAPAFGSYHLRVSGGSGQSRIRNSFQLPVNEGDRVLAQGMCKRVSGTSGVARVVIRFRDDTGALIGSNVGNGVTSTSYAQSRAVGIAPAGAVLAEFEFDRTAGSDTCDFDGALFGIIPRDLDIDALGTTNAPAEPDANNTEGRRSLSDLQDTQTFTPSWGAGQFTPSAPTGDISYAISLDGRFAELWFPQDIFGASDSNTLSFTNLPAAIRPAGNVATFALGLGIARDNGVTDQLCAARVWGANHASSGTVEFMRYFSGSFNSGFWTSGGASKGIAKGTRFRWPI